MLNREIILQRLALIKQLYKIGLDQSKQFEPIAAFSILSFHDSIEMFLKLLAEKNGINSDKFSFLQYWENIPTLTLKESLRNLNARRVNIKHKGLLPSKSDIEISRVNTIDFFDQNVFTHFDIKFDEISLLTLIKNNNIKLLVSESQKALDKANFEECIEKIAVAFHDLLDFYENNKSGNFRVSPFFFGKNMLFNSSFFIGIEDKRMANFVDSVQESIMGMQTAIKITSLGIDYRKFIKFKLLTPSVTKTIGGKHVLELYGNKKWTIDNCQYCIDFVIDSALKLQDFDFDIEELEEQEKFTIVKKK